MACEATMDACIAGVVGRISNGSVTLQVGGVGAHAMGPLAPGDVRLSVLCNIKLQTELGWQLLASDRGAGFEALRLVQALTTSSSKRTKSLSLCALSMHAQKRVKGNA